MARPTSGQRYLPIRGAAGRQFSGSALRPLAPILRRQLADLVERLTVRLRAEIPHYAAMDAAEVAEQAELQLRHVLSELSGEPVASADGPTAYGRLRAEQGVPLEVVLHAYRGAWAELWDGLVSGARSDGPSGQELLRASTEFLWMAHEHHQRLPVSYRQRAMELLVTHEAERAAT